MHIFLMRHGIAELARGGAGDRERALTERGREKMRRQAAVMRRIGWSIDHLVTSPYRRARQTAAVLAESLSVEAEPDELLGLGSVPGDVGELLRRYERLRGVCFVGHQPDLSSVVHFLTGHALNLRPGGLAVVEVQRFREGGGQLRGLYDPDVMERLAESQAL